VTPSLSPNLEERKKRRKGGIFIPFSYFVIPGKRRGREETVFRPAPGQDFRVPPRELELPSALLKGKEGSRIIRVPSTNERREKERGGGVRNCK